ALPDLRRLAGGDRLDRLVDGPAYLVGRGPGQCPHLGAPLLGRAARPPPLPHLAGHVGQQVAEDVPREPAAGGVQGRLADGLQEGEVQGHAGAPSREGRGANPARPCRAPGTTSPGSWYGSTTLAGG